jgi:hypothetical protein
MMPLEGKAVGVAFANTHVTYVCGATREIPAVSTAMYHCRSLVAWAKAGVHVDIRRIRRKIAT